MAEIMLPIRFIFQKPVTGNQGSEKQRHPSEDTEANLGEPTATPKETQKEGGTIRSSSTPLAPNEVLRISSKNSGARAWEISNKNRIYTRTSKKKRRKY